MKKIISLLFLIMLCCNVLFAQLKIDSDGKLLWGESNYFGTSQSMYFQDLYTGNSCLPFRVIRSENGNVSLSRNNYRMLFYPLSGSMAIGNAVPDNDNSSYVPLSVYANTYGRMTVNLTTAYVGPGIKSTVDYTGGKPFSAYYNNTEVFYVDGNGNAHANGQFITSDISLKSNIETISNPLDKVMQLRGVTFALNFPKNEDAPIDFETVFSKAQLQTPTLTRELFQQIQSEKTRKH